MNLGRGMRMARAHGNLWARIHGSLIAGSVLGAPLLFWSVVAFFAGTWLLLGGSGVAQYNDVLPGLSTIASAIEGALRKNPDASTRAQIESVTQLLGLVAPLLIFSVLILGRVQEVNRHLRQLAQSLTSILTKLYSGHIVIVGDSAEARSLALDCRKHNDAVVLITGDDDLPEVTANGLRRRGILLLQTAGDYMDSLREARSHHAASVVAFEAEDASNLQIEATVRGLIGTKRPRRPVKVHVAIRSPVLLKEAREMHSRQMRGRSERVTPIDSKPFALEELAARTLIQREAHTLLTSAEVLQLPRVHIVFFGFDLVAEAIANSIIKCLWSIHFEAPRMTVLTPTPEAVEGGFRARYREAFAHRSLWTPDIVFLQFDWQTTSIGPELLDLVEQARGKPAAAIVSSGTDVGNIQASLALERACNQGLRWPIPIYLHEVSQSEFSRQYARGDETEELDAYQQAFGSHQTAATRQKVISGSLDLGAAIAHEHYSMNLSNRTSMTLRELQAAARFWPDVLETYRAANRAVADSALVKLWDAGWRPVGPGEKGDTDPSVDDSLLGSMAECEHNRWMAERLMSGWRPPLDGEGRNNELMVHDKLVSWDQLTFDDRNRDVVQIRSAIDIARLLHPRGFVRRSG
jgi:hypothetical protein